MPRHVAIIMDGNGRWAKQKGKLRTFGHKAGVESVRNSVRFCRQSSIESLTLFAFSSENWQRPVQEVSTLMELFSLVLGSEVKKLHKNNVRLRVVGDTSRFDSKLVDKIIAAEELTKDNTSLTLNIAANYGGKWEVVNSCKNIIKSIKEGLIDVDDVDEAVFEQHTTLAGQPSVDLMIRTGGDHRISNFLLWHIAYAELYFTNTLWPDFNEDAFQLAIDEFQSRQRRYGMLNEQVNGN